jgi:hypothetical protein
VNGNLAHPLGPFAWPFGPRFAEKVGRLHLAEALSYRTLAEDLRRAA